MPSNLSARKQGRRHLPPWSPESPLQISNGEQAYWQIARGPWRNWGAIRWSAGKMLLTGLGSSHKERRPCPIPSEPVLVSRRSPELCSRHLLQEGTHRSHPAHRSCVTYRRGPPMIPHCLDPGGSPPGTFLWPERYRAVSEDKSL